MSKPRHRVLANALRARIASGEWTVGTRLPSEVELADAFDVSRATLRRAFTDLEADRLIERRRRVGTTVIARRAGPRFRMVTDGVEDVLSLTRDTALQVHAVQRVPDPLPDWPDAPPSDTGDWLEVVGTRTLPDDDTAFNCSRVLVTGSHADISPRAGARIGSVYGLIEARYGIRISRVRQSAVAVACSREQAGLLGLKRGAPLMRIDARLYAADDRLVELSTAFFDPARFRLRTDVRLEPPVGS